MNIALVIERMDVDRGGREMSVAQTATELAARGHTVTVLCQSGSWSSETVNVRPLGHRGITRAGRLKHFIAAVQTAAETERFDIVHATLPVPGANVYQPRGGTLPAQQAASQRRRTFVGAPFASVFASFRRSRELLAEMEQQVMDDPSCLCLAVSEMVAGEFAHYYRRTTGVKVVYNAVDLPEIDDETFADWRQRLRYKLGVTQSDPVFISVAKNFQLKGVDRAIEHFARWYHDNDRRINARLILVGRENVEGYQRHASLREVGKQVHLIPPTDNVHEYYAAADACILLSWYDPCSRVVLEATRWSLPSITTQYNGAGEILGDGAGYVVDSPADRPGVMTALDALSDVKVRRRMAEACRTAAESITIERHVDRLLQAYREVASK